MIRTAQRVLARISHRSLAKISHRSLATTSTSTTPYISSDQTHFGFENVAVAEKEQRVKQVFENVADTYDVMNDVMSGGLHRYWKDYLLSVSAVGPISRAVRMSQAKRQFKILDVAGGTGDIAFRFIEAADCVERAKSSGEDPVQVTVCDINAEMLRVGQKRAEQRGYHTSNLKFVQGNAQDLVQFEDNSFDLYTIAFGLRNVTDVDKALSEACRVLKPGGRFMCLEFSAVPNPALATLYDTYSFHVIPTMGELIAKDRASYQYLVESIRKFLKQDELVARMQHAGMEQVKYTNLTGGIVALHEGYKPF